MQVSVTFRNLQPNEQVKQYAIEKCTRLKKYLNMPVDAHVVMSRRRYEYSAEIKISKDGTVLVGEGTGEDLNSCIDIAVDKVERQIKKVKDRRRVKKRKSESEGLAVRHAVVQRDQPSGGTMIVKSEEFSAKPMPVDEAILQMEANGSDFFVFLNSSTNQVNVIYRRKDGTIGLIEAGEA